jgi:hypothetical protein
VKRANRVGRDEPLPEQDDRPVEVDNLPRAELRNCQDCGRYTYTYWTRERYRCSRCRREALK